MVCGWENSDGRGKVLQVRDGAEGEERRSIEHGQVEFVTKVHGRIDV